MELYDTDERQELILVPRCRGIPWEAKSLTYSRYSLPFIETGDHSTFTEYLWSLSIARCIQCINAAPYFLKIHSSLLQILKFTYFLQNFCVFLTFSVRAICPPNATLLDVIILIIFYEEYKQ
jgi:hypothetical protein